MSRPSSSVLVVYPNLKVVQTGVSSTIFALARMLPAFAVDLRVFGVGLPPDIRPASFPSLVAAVMSRPRPVIWHARRNIDMLLGILLKMLNPKLRLVFTSAAQRRHTRYTNALIAAMDLVVATSEKSAAYVPRASHVVPHGVDTARFLNEDRRAARRRTGLAPEAFYIGSFGAVRPGKGSDLLVDALVGVLGPRPGWKAVFVGHVGLSQWLFARRLKRRLAAAGLLGRVAFMGHVSDIRDYLAGVDICVAASRKEGFGLTPLEAMASGVAVVASGAGSFPETVIEGETGLLFETGNADALSRCLARLMDEDSLRRAMGARGRAHVAASFGLEREAAALARLYRQLCEVEAGT